jgi:ankyrin repeat protein
VKLLEIARPLRDRAAQVIQRHWKRSSVNPINCAGVVTAANAWELIALSARCLEVLASQSVSASDHMSREGLFYSMLAQLSGSDGALLGLIRRSVPHETQTFALNILLKVQRQSIATLSSVMLNAGGLGLEHVDIKTAKRALLFVARFHWDDDTRGEADALQRRMPDGAGLPHPYDWDESDVLTWITCTGMGELSQGILEYVRLRSLRPLWERKESRTSGWVKTATPGQHLLNLTMHKLTIPPVCASESSAHSFIRMLRLLRLEASATARYLSSGWASQGNAGEDTSNTDLLTAYAKRQHTLTERSRLYRELEEALARTHAGEGMEDTLTLIEGRGRSMGQYACMGRGYVEAVDAFGNLRTLRMLHSGGAAPTHQGDPPAGLRFERCYRDLQTGGVIEVYDGSMYQLALVDEVRRVLGQARNQLRGTTFDIIRGSQAAGKGRCAVLAVMKEATRPAKHVTLELSSRSDEREVGDPEGHMSISLGILEDATGVSHIHILDLVDVTNGQDPRDGRTALMRAIIDGNDDLSLALLERDVDICLSDAEQRNALLHAVILKRDAVAQSILRRYNHLIRTEQGASNDSLNGEIICISFQASQLRYLTQLICCASGMLDTRDVTGRAAIHHAVADLEERFDIVQSLLQAKARVGIRDSSGNSPLHLACEYGHVDIVKALIKYNANTGSKNNSAKTPLHIASGKLHIKIVSILLKENQAALVTAEVSWSHF